MKKKETANKQPTMPAATRPPSKYVDDYGEALDITEEEIAKLNTSEKINLANKAIELKAKAEKAGLSFVAKELLERTVIIVDKYLSGKTANEGKDIRRQDWESNHAIILSAIHNYVLHNNSFPAVNTLTKETGLSRQTIHEHLKEGIAGEFYQERLKTWEALTDNIFKNLYYQAIQNGSVAASKVLLDHICKISQPPANNISQQNNYIQINNTKIDEVTIAELPEGARAQIIEIIHRHAIKKAI
jgi:hypothetical protein